MPEKDISPCQNKIGEKQEVDDDGNNIGPENSKGKNCAKCDDNIQIKNFFFRNSLHDYFI